MVEEEAPRKDGRRESPRTTVSEITGVCSTNPPRHRIPALSPALAINESSGLRTLAFRGGGGLLQVPGNLHLSSHTSMKTRHLKEQMAASKEISANFTGSRRCHSKRGYKPESRERMISLDKSPLPQLLFEATSTSSCLELCKSPHSPVTFTLLSGYHEQL